MGARDVERNEWERGLVSYSNASKITMEEVMMEQLRISRVGKSQVDANCTVLGCASIQLVRGSIQLGE